MEKLWRSGRDISLQTIVLALERFNAGKMGA